ncbi:MAG: chemotaxis protein CheW [Desulfuromusa sp.]|nr:chemotaxis protein CheW [Desulfuromusa sp.]
MKRFGLFRVGELGFAIPLAQIQKILQDSRGYRLPRLPGAVSAVLVDDGQLIPWFDLEQMLGEGTPLEQPMQGYQVLVESEYGTVALPADLTGRIVTEQKGQLVSMAVEEKDFGAIGKFIYQSEEYIILDINFLAIVMTQGGWQNQPDTGGARRHQ